MLINSSGLRKKKPVSASHTAPR
jgi:hypothetical protein